MPLEKLGGGLAPCSLTRTFHQMVPLSKQTIVLKIIPTPSWSRGDPMLYWFSAVLAIVGVVMLSA